MASIKSKLKSVVSSAKKKITSAAKSVSASLGASASSSQSRPSSTSQYVQTTKNLTKPPVQTKTVNQLSAAVAQLKNSTPNQSVIPSNQSKPALVTKNPYGATSSATKNLAPGALQAAVDKATGGKDGPQSKVKSGSNKSVNSASLSLASLEDPTGMLSEDPEAFVSSARSSSASSRGASSASSGGSSSSKNGAFSAGADSGGGAGGSGEDLSPAEQLKRAQQEADKLEKDVSNLYQRDETAAQGAIASDEPVVRDEQDAMNKLKDTDLTPTRDALRALDAEIKRNEQLLTEELSSIQGTFDAQKTSDINAQAGETGQLSVGVANAGGFLGFSGSGAGVMLKLAESHRAELNSLEAQRQKALTDARSAAAERRFDIVQLKAKEIARIDQETYERTEEYNTRVRKNAETSAKIAQTKKDQTDIYEAIKGGAKTPMAIFSKLGGSVDIDTIASTLEDFGANGSGSLKLSATQTAGLIGAGMSMDDISAFNEYVSENGYDAKIKASLSPAQRRAADDIFSTGAIGSGSASNFTDQESRKLEQAGLLNAPRQTQLDFLYGGDNDSPYESVYTGQIIDGKTTVSSLPLAEQKKVKEELLKFGFGSDVVPQFYRDNMEATNMQTPTADYLKSSWNTYRKTALGEAISSASDEPAWWQVWK